MNRESDLNNKHKDFSHSGDYTPTGGTTPGLRNVKLSEDFSFHSSELIPKPARLDVLKELRQVLRRSAATSASLYLESDEIYLLASVGNKKVNIKAKGIRVKALLSGANLVSRDMWYEPVTSIGSSKIHLILTNFHDRSSEVLDNVHSSIFKLSKTLSGNNGAYIFEQLCSVLLKERDQVKREKEEKTRLLHATSHDLSTPVSAINGYLELLNMCLENGNDKSKTEHYQEQITKGVEYISDILEQLDDILHLDENAQQCDLIKVELNWIVNEVSRLCEPFAEQKNINLTVHSEDQALYVYADTIKLKKALYNIVHNACTFTPKGGNVSVTVFDSGDKGCVSVLDNGVGIADHERQKIFNPYQKLGAKDDLKRKSAFGLGLYMSKEYCKMMGADILVDSDKGRGSNFTVVLNQEETRASQQSA